MSDYLWDKAGEPDAEVERLEVLLSSFGHAPRPLALPAEESSVARLPPRRSGAWRRFFPARLFEPVGLAFASALVLALLLGASVLMRARSAMDEGGAVSREARRTPPPASSSRKQSGEASSSQAPERHESPSTPREIANAVRESEPANVRAKGGGGLPAVRDVLRKRAGAASVVKPRPGTTATAEQTAARTGGTGTLEAMSERGRVGATTLFDGTRLMAKEQLIYALRLTGAKLKEVEGKAHGAGEQKAGAGGGVR
jgi:hypothetical protein